MFVSKKTGALSLIGFSALVLISAILAAMALTGMAQAGILETKDKQPHALMPAKIAGQGSDNPPPVTDPIKPLASRPISVDEIDSVIQKPSKKPYTLRCWQEGKLLFERQLARLPVQSRRTQSLDGNKHLYDMDNAICLVQKDGEPVDSHHKIN